MEADLNLLDDQERVLIIHALTELATKQTIELDEVLTLLGKLTGMQTRVWVATMPE